MNKAGFIKKLMEKTGKEENECIIINEIWESGNIFGHKNKDKKIKAFVEKLNITEEEANKLYNICAESVVEGVFKR